MVFGDAVSKLETFVWILNPYFKVHNLVSVYPKSIILGQMTNLNTIFRVVVPVYWFVKIWNSSQFPAEFRNGQWKTLKYFIPRALVQLTFGVCGTFWGWRRFIRLRTSRNLRIPFITPSSCELVFFLSPHPSSFILRCENDENGSRRKRAFQ